MALLYVNTVALDGDVRAANVKITLTDIDGRVVTNGETEDGIVVAPVRTKTDTDGTLTMDVIPNADISPENTFYKITVGTYSAIIEKGSGAESVEDIVAVSGDALGTAATLNSLSDVDTTGVADGDSLTYDSGTTSWVPGAGGGGGGVTSVSGTAPIVSSGGATPAISIAAASGAAAGSMSASDKTKLDGIETAATADQTAAEILAKILTVDGSGSGLDADLLDGLNSSAFESSGAAAAALVSALAADQSVLIEAKTGSSSSYDFTSIPSTYRILRLFFTLRSSLSSTTDTLTIAINGDTTAANYDTQRVEERSGATTQSETLGTSRALGEINAGTALTSAHSIGCMTIVNYASTGTLKMIDYQWTRWTARTTTTLRRWTGVVAWASTAAINQLTLTPTSGSWGSASSAYLYGIR